MTNKVGRNEACPCGSGKKYKQCCLRKGVHDPFSKHAPMPSGPALLPTSATSAPAAALARTPTPATPSLPPRRTLRGAVFTLGAAREISRGGALPDLDLHPWIVAQLRDRTGIGPGGKPPTWTITRVRAMDTAALQQALARLGVAVAPSTFVEGAQEQLSAWDLSLDWTPVPGADVEFLGLVACELWRRWVPEMPSLEMIDERMQDGYDALENGEGRVACQIWLDVWGLLLDALPDALSAQALDEGFATGLNRIGNWIVDASIEILNHVRKDAELMRRARTVYEVAAERLGDRHVRMDLAELYYTSGQTAAGEAVLEALIRDEPDHPGGYAALSDHLSWRGNGAYVDLARAITLIERALARPVKDAASWDLPRRLAELRERV